MKRAVALILALITVFAGAFSFSSCGLGKDNSKIYVVREEVFKDAVKLDDGVIEKVLLKKLEDADEQNFITGKKYYAIAYADNKKISQGFFKFFNEVKIESGDFYFGAKKSFKTDMTLSYPAQENPTVTGYSQAMINIDTTKAKKSDCYIAVGFIPTNADNEKFYINFQYYEGSSNRDFSTNKTVMYNKQISAESSIKYLSYEDYMAGNYDDKLEDSVGVAVGQKFFAVIDYKLSSFKDIEETDTATVSITTKSDSVEKYKIRVEEFPTADYSSTDTSATANFTLKDGGDAGKTYRFIISLTADDGGKIDISATISAKQISFLNAKEVTSTAYIDTGAKLESKLEFTLSGNGEYYTVTGLGQETSNVIKIPSTHKEKPVLAIADNVFSNSTHISEVVLPDGLESIGAGAFGNCTGLDSIIIPSSVSRIGDGAFSGCSIISIYCEANEMPSTWSESWVDLQADVTWGYGDK